MPRKEKSSMGSPALRAAAVGLAVLLFAGAAFADGEKSLSGILRRVNGNELTVQPSGLFHPKPVIVEMNEATKKTGQVAQGMQVKLKYREQDGKKIVTEIEARPQFASRRDKDASKQIQPPPPPK